MRLFFWYKKANKFLYKMTKKCSLKILDSEQSFWYNKHIKANKHSKAERNVNNMKKRRKKTVVVNRRRFTAFLTVLLILTCCGFSSVKKGMNKNIPEIISVFVTPGDTLWSIAADNNPQNKDIRKIVQVIKKYNGLQTNTIHAGDELYIPI